MHADFGLKNKFQLACRRLDMSVYVVDHDLQSLCNAGEVASTWTMSLFNMWMECSQPQEVIAIGYNPIIIVALLQTIV